jgi:hypothetical protein
MEHKPSSGKGLVDPGILLLEISIRKMVKDASKTLATGIVFILLFLSINLNV